MIKVKLITQKSDLELAFKIRHQVFVVEQNVSPDIELDENEAESRHFLAESAIEACGTARWRFTENGIKLERFAVLAAYRSKGVGSVLLETILADIKQMPETQGKKIYLHAQISAMGLYKKFGFQPEGEMFEEADIQHYKMVLV
jgi:predicted GNAT family N-acyltransferase